MENLKTCVEMAAKKMVMLSIETVDNPFLNSLSKVDYLKTQIHSPFLQAYFDELFDRVGIVREPILRKAA